jgi:hypothetical protein
LNIWVPVCGCIRSSLCAISILMEMTGLKIMFITMEGAIWVPSKTDKAIQTGSTACMLTRTQNCASAAITTRSFSLISTSCTKKEWSCTLRQKWAGWRATGIVI